MLADTLYQFKSTLYPKSSLESRFSAEPQKYAQPPSELYSGLSTVNLRPSRSRSSTRWIYLVASWICSRPRVKTTIFRAIACSVFITITICRFVVEIFGHPSLPADFHRFVGLVIAGAGESPFGHLGRFRVLARRRQFYRAATWLIFARTRRVRSNLFLARRRRTIAIFTHAGRRIARGLGCKIAVVVATCRKQDQHEPCSRYRAGYRRAPPVTTTTLFSNCFIGINIQSCSFHAISRQP